MPAQLAWLERRLTDQPASGSVLILHHPPKNNASIQHHFGKLEDLLIRCPVRVLLCGHTHQVTQTRFAGIPCFVAPSTAYGILMQNTERRFTNQIGFQLLELYPGNLSCRFIRQPTEMEILLQQHATRSAFHVNEGSWNGRNASNRGVSLPSPASVFIR